MNRDSCNVAFSSRDSMLLQARPLTDRERADLDIATTLHASILGAGASLSTALIVPGLFVQQLERDRERKETK